MFVYKGCGLSDLKGCYLYSDFVFARIWALNQSGNNQLLLEAGLGIISFGTDVNNELYVCSFDGKIYKLTAVN